MSRLFFFLIPLLFFSCGKDSAGKKPEPLSREFKNYWYSGKAEITSYKLKQARYGEMREGTAVLVYVTEDFLPEEQVKANGRDKDNISVLKLNAVKKFVTGIYPYSIMQSSFYPVDNNRHAIKVSASAQEWCGQVYMQLNNRDKFEVISHSYFQGEADQHLELPKQYLENEIWNQLRINPSSLPTGNIKMLPSFEFLRLHHKEIKAYDAVAGFLSKENIDIYNIEYPELHRKLSIYFQREFPYAIQKWEETAESGFGKNARVMTTTAEKMVSIKSAYWTKNGNKDLSLRKKLHLD